MKGRMLSAIGRQVLAALEFTGDTVLLLGRAAAFLVRADLERQCLVRVSDWIYFERPGEMKADER